MAFDWIETFLIETEGIRSPESFRLWTAIATLAGVLERRTWTHTDSGLLYPNLYTILSGAPSSGKSLCVNTARNLWATVAGLHLGPDNPTKASFLDCLEAATRVATNGSGNSIYCALSVACREFGVLIPKHDPAFLEDLTDLYDNPIMYTAPRRSTKSLVINKPTVNILAAVTPDFLHDLLPETAWGQGFTSRLLFIYGTKDRDMTRDIFKKRRDLNTALLSAKLTEYFEELHGEFEWHPETMAAVNEWFQAGLPPVPNYGRLQHYLGRREVHTLKLCMISCVSAEHGMCVTRSDFERAKRWLLGAEALMPDVFRAMAQKSDTQLIHDLHFHVYSLYSRVARDKRKPIAEAVIWEFLKDRAPSERIPRIIDTAEKSGWLLRGTYPGEYVPRPLSEVHEP